jgi:hemoglobin
MDDAGLPDDVVFRAAMRGYLQWAIGEISGRPETGALPPESAVLPRWSWEGLLPPAGPQ